MCRHHFRHGICRMQSRLWLACCRPVATQLQISLGYLETSLLPGQPHLIEQRNECIIPRTAPVRVCLKGRVSWRTLQTAERHFKPKVANRIGTRYVPTNTVKYLVFSNSLIGNCTYAHHVQYRSITWYFAHILHFSFCLYPQNKQWWFPYTLNLYNGEITYFLRGWDPNFYLLLDYLDTQHHTPLLTENIDLL
jgi:hypothetical protein